MQMTPLHLRVLLYLHDVIRSSGRLNRSPDMIRAAEDLTDEGLLTNRQIPRRPIPRWLADTYCITQHGRDHVRGLCADRDRSPMISVSHTVRLGDMSVTDTVNLVDMDYSELERRVSAAMTQALRVPMEMLSAKGGPAFETGPSRVIATAGGTLVRCGAEVKVYEWGIGIKREDERAWIPNRAMRSYADDDSDRTGLVYHEDGGLKLRGPHWGYPLSPGDVVRFHESSISIEGGNRLTVTVSGV